MTQQDIQQFVELLHGATTKNITTYEAINNFIEFSKSKCRKDTIKYYLRMKQYITTFFNEYNINSTSQINTALLNKLVIYYSNLSTTTINKFIDFLKMVMKYNYDNEFISKDPIRDYKKLKKSKVIIKTIPLDIEDKIINYFDSMKDTTLNLRNKVLIHLLAETGARLNELIHMKTSLLNLKLNRILLEYTKCDSQRYVYFSDLTKELLIKYLNKVQPKEYLLINTLTKEQIDKTSIYKTLDRVKRHLNLTISISPHKWRHTLATNLLNNNVNIKNIQTVLGHSSLNTTQIYLHTVDQEVHDVVTNILNKKTDIS